MILSRYFAREVLAAMVSVAAVVLVISMGWRFGAYLNQAASGVLSKDVLFMIMAFRLPTFLEPIIPVSFFLGLMLAYGRMYADSEMVILESCGIGPSRLISISLGLSTIVMVATLTVSLWLAPTGERQVELLLDGQQQSTEFDTLAPGRFQMIRSGRRVTYTEQIGDDGTLRHVFMSESNLATTAGPKDVDMVVAESGDTRPDGLGNRFLVLNNGIRYSGMPGEQSYQIIEFGEYGQMIARETARYREVRTTAVSTLELLNSDDPELVGELQWRVSMVLMIPVIALLALPLSRTNPRQGRFTRLIPGMLLCFLYLGSLSAAKTSLQQGNLPQAIGLWWLHGVFLAIAFVLNMMQMKAR
ncbi:MAG: LPS export ABC transporter permease LptF [Proteobacteria bacterium]|jgi:lipopolysaccharide export system permease protein|nr:LPS export ABC transporter permease LptF [Pseudomonadota bacterium]